MTLNLAEQKRLKLLNDLEAQAIAAQPVLTAQRPQAQGARQAGESIVTPKLVGAASLVSRFEQTKS